MTKGWEPIVVVDDDDDDDDVFEIVSDLEAYLVLDRWDGSHLCEAVGDGLVEGGVVCDVDLGGECADSVAAEAAAAADVVGVQGSADGETESYGVQEGPNAAVAENEADVATIGSGGAEGAKEGRRYCWDGEGEGRADDEAVDLEWGAEAGADADAAERWKLEGRQNGPSEQKRLPGVVRQGVCAAAQAKLWSAEAGAACGGRGGRRIRDGDARDACEGWLCFGRGFDREGFWLCRFDRRRRWGRPHSP